MGGIKQKICKGIMKLCGWKLVKNEEFPEKCVICVAPHTSNWDFFYGMIGYSALGGSGKQFMIKKDWFFFPLNILFNALGGIPIDRSKRCSVTDQLVEVCNKSNHFHIGITPEATRSRNPNWKRGFYYIAKKANLPIVIIYLDYEKKEGGIKAVFHPTDDAEADMINIKRMYLGVKGKVPENFTTGLEEENNL